MAMKRVTVYCSSSTSLEPKFFNAATKLGEAMAKRGLELVYGGGGIGLMGEVARSLKKNGGRIHGIITKRLLALEQGFDGCDELMVVDTMSERKKLMAEHGEAFIALPGGLGTFEEFFEVLVQRQVGEHCKPIGLVNLGGYYDPLINLIDQPFNLSTDSVDIITQGSFDKPNHLTYIKVEATYRSMAIATYYF
jgi:uncharacterized protein (TIGR00730 family)